MNSWQYVISTIAAAVVLLLSVWTVTSSESNRSLELEIQQEALKIQQFQQLQGGMNVLLREMIQVSAKNETMRQLLARHGINVNIKPPTPGETPAVPAP